MGNKEINGYKFVCEYDEYKMMLYEKSDGNKTSAVFVIRGKREFSDDRAAAKIGVAASKIGIVGTPTRVERFRKAISNYLMQRVKDKETELTEVTLTGHSLGGHFAAVVTARIRDFHSDPNDPVWQLAHNIKCYTFNAASHYTKAEKVLIQKVPNIYFLILQGDVISEGFFGNLPKSLNVHDKTTQCVLFTRLKPPDTSGFFSTAWKLLTLQWFSEQDKQHQMINFYDPEKQEYTPAKLVNIPRKRHLRWNKNRECYGTYKPAPKATPLKVVYNDWFSKRRKVAV